MGNAIFLDVHILVNPEISVSEGHYIAQKVQAQLIRKIPDVSDVTVHVDPEDDELNLSPSSALMARGEIIQILKKEISFLEETDLNRCLEIHYLNGKIAIKLNLPISIQSQIVVEDLELKLQSMIQQHPMIDSLMIRWARPELSNVDEKN